MNVSGVIFPSRAKEAKKQKNAWSQVTVTHFTLLTQVTHISHVTQVT